MARDRSIEQAKAFAQRIRWQQCDLRQRHGGHRRIDAPSLFDRGLDPPDFSLGKRHFLGLAGSGVEQQQLGPAVSKVGCVARNLVEQWQNLARVGADQHGDSRTAIEIGLDRRGPQFRVRRQRVLRTIEDSGRAVGELLFQIGKLAARRD